jgi:hypothetical protein
MIQWVLVGLTSNREGTVTALAVSRVNASMGSRTMKMDVIQLAT